MALDLRGLNPAPVTPFTTDGDIDFAAIQRLGSWLGSIDGVKSLVVLGHAGEGTFLTIDEQLDVIRAFVDSTDGRVPVIAGITGEGNKVARRTPGCRRRVQTNSATEMRAGKIQSNMASLRDCIADAGR